MKSGNTELQWRKQTVSINVLLNFVWVRWREGEAGEVELAGDEERTVRMVVKRV